MPDRFSSSARGALPMPWKETCVVDEKMAFIGECLRGELPMTMLCARFGISRDTGYRLLKRYRAEGAAGLAARSRAPHHHGLAMAEEIATAIIALRGDRPHWGPKQLRAALRRRAPHPSPPPPPPLPPPPPPLA